MAAYVLGIPEHKLRVVAPDVGGGFGSKIFLYAEEALCVWAAKLVGRPIKWTAERSESFHATPTAATTTRAPSCPRRRRQVPRHAGEDGRRDGAYLSTFASSVPTILYATLLAGQYTTPAIHCEVTAVFTNTAPVDAYRGAGRPEATYVVERLVATAAREMNIAQDEIRRRNFIRTFPYATPVALTYDIGDYDACLEARCSSPTCGLRGAPPGGAAPRQAARPRLRLVHRGVRPRALGRGRSPGRARRPLRSGRSPRASHRQGHGLHRLALARPGPRDHVRAGGGGAPRHRHRGRRDRAWRHRRIPFGMGTYGSRSIAVGGAALMRACDKIIAKGRRSRRT
jgi:carbon-monoxide dehydrogenase large subunit